MRSSLPARILYLFFGGVILAPSPLLGASRTEICLNGQWLLHPGGDEKKVPDAQWIPMNVPGLFGRDQGRATLFHQGDYAWLKTSVLLPGDWFDGRRICIRFLSVEAYAHVYVNGRSAGRHIGHGPPFELDITPLVRPGKDNQLAVYVANYRWLESQGKPVSLGRASGEI